MTARDRRRLRLGRAGAALLVALVAVGHSEAAPRVPLSLRECGARLDDEQLRALVDLEVATSGLAAPITAVVVVHCGPGARRFAVTIHGGQAGRQLARISVARGRPGHAERELALVIAERLRREQERAAAATSAGAPTADAASAPVDDGGVVPAVNPGARAERRTPRHTAPAPAAEAPAGDPPLLVDPASPASASTPSEPGPDAVAAPTPAPPRTPSSTPPPPATGLDSAGVPAPPPAAALVPAVSPAPSPPPSPRNPQRMREAGIATLALLGVTIGTFAAGGAVLGVGNSPPTNQDLQIAGATTLSVAVVPAIATIAAMGVWLREKLR